MDTVPLSRWTIESHREPSVRVGVILPSDRMRSIRIVLPSPGYQILGHGRPLSTATAGPAEVFAQGAGLTFRSANLRTAPADALTLAPLSPVELRPGAGVEVRGVLAGRGFHWQKRVSLTLPGALEFRAAEPGMLAVNELPLEDYLAGVITAEMSGACPLEFLKSQVLVARSWVLVHTEDKHPGLPIDRCNDDCCQRYQGTGFLTESAMEAVRRTRGQAIFHAGGQIIDANYSKSCGGIIEAPEFLWGAPKPGQRSALDAPPASPAQQFHPLTEENLQEYLSGAWAGHSDVFCSPGVVPEDQLPRYLGGVDEGGAYFRWTLHYAREDLERLLREKLFSRFGSGRGGALGTLLDLRPLRRGRSGRIIELAVDYLDPLGQPAVHTIRDQYNIRNALHEKFLFSSAFAVRAQRDAGGVPSAFTLVGAGWGHGAGLCQIGALGMALRGHSAEQIVRHYFEGVELRTCYERAC